MDTEQVKRWLWRYGVAAAAEREAQKRTADNAEQMKMLAAELNRFAQDLYANPKFRSLREAEEQAVYSVWQRLRAVYGVGMQYHDS